MGTSITNLQGTFYNPILKENTKHFADFKRLDGITYRTGVVKLGMEHRPDLVADYYLGSPDLAWIITYANDFENGVEDYVLGRKLRIPSV